MSDRDRFADLSQKALSQEEMTQQDRQFWIEYILRYLKNKKTDDYALPDILEWNFTGDNVVFNTTQLLIQAGYLTVGYAFEDLITPGNIEIGGGGNTQIDCITVYGTDIYVGGDFSKIEGVTANGIAKYDTLTGTWSALAGGITAVRDIAFDSNGILYAASTSTTEFNRIAQWDGTTWSAVGAGTNNAIYGIFIKDDILYMGGNFTTANGSPAYRFASYNIATTAWTAYGDVFSGGIKTIYDVAVDSSDNIYVGGSFTAPGSYIAKWNGSSWEAMDVGFTTNVFAIYIDSSDNVYAGGSKNNTYNIQKWNGTTWDFLSGINENIYNIDGYSTTVYAGGQFTTPSLDVAKWTGSKWIALQDTLTTAGTSSTSITGMDIDTNNRLYLTGYTRNSSNTILYYVKKLSVPSTVSGDILGYTAEDTDYKSTDDRLAADSDVLYPSQSAVRDYAPKKKIIAAAPTVDDDVTLDYRIGDIWIDIT